MERSRGNGGTDVWGTWGSRIKLGFIYREENVCGLWNGRVRGGEPKRGVDVWEEWEF